MKSFKYAALLLLFSIVFMSCEKQEYFKSESSIKKELQHQWLRSVISNSDSRNEIWEFKDGKLIITGSTNSTIPLEGEFSVKTTLSKVFITTKNFPTTAADSYDGAKWQVTYLHSGILTMAAEDPTGGGLIQREFTRQD